MACFSAVSDDLALNPGSSAARGSTAIAPPWTRSSNPSASSRSMSRRTVTSETSSLLDEPGDLRGGRPPRRARGWRHGAGWRARSPLPDHGRGARGEPAPGPTSVAETRSCPDAVTRHASSVWFSTNNCASRCRIGVARPRLQRRGDHRLDTRLAQHGYYGIILNVGI